MGLVKKLVKLSEQRRTETYKLISLGCGVVIFTIVFPAAFIWIGGIMKTVFTISSHPIIDNAITIVSIVFGVYFLAWSTITQWKIGKGTPAPNASTKKLVVEGPYKLCRNPIELGAVSYYLGLGTYFDSLTVGVWCAIFGLIVGTMYHKFIEEKELEVRFGEEYQKYREKTPFLIPKVWVRK